MRILYLITRAELGGAQVHVLDLIRGLRSKFDLEIAAGEDGFLLEEARQIGIHCHVLPSLVQPIHPLKDVRALFAVRSLLRERRPDLLHLHTSKAGIVGRLAAWSMGVPSVFTAHTWCFAEGTSFKWKLVGVPLERLAGALGGHIITVSEANRQLALQAKVGRPDRITTVHNGVASASYTSDAPKLEPPTVVMVARFAAQKDPELLLRAAAEINVPFRVQFVGDGPRRPEMERLAEKLGIGDKVAFLGDRSDVTDILARASVFALISHWEGFPLSILEAMRARLPIIATDVGGVRESLTHGVNGYLIPRNDQRSLTLYLQRLLEDAHLRQTMGQASLNEFLGKFTADIMLQKTVRLYADVLEAARRPLRDGEAAAPVIANERSHEVAATGTETGIY